MTDNDTFVRNGVLSAVFAFSMWGAFPIYFKVAEGVPAIEMLLHRIVWAVPFGAMIVAARRQWPEIKQALSNKRTLGILALSAAVISVNWLLYIWAVQHEQVFEASLGYYINPLMLVLVGAVFLGERLRRMQIVAVLLAVAGVTVLAVSGDHFPYISIALAVSFTTYGAIRKQVAVGAMPGLFVETLILFPLSAIYLAVIVQSGSSSFGLSNPAMAGLLMLAGPFTVLPLLFFAIAARRLRLSTIGFLQFIGPTGQFLVGYYYGEPLTPAHIVCFGLIWTAVLIFIVDVLFAARPALTAIANRPE